MELDTEIRQAVVASFPEVKDINDSDLRERVYDAWTMSLQLNGYSKAEELEHSGTPGVLVSSEHSQVDHVRGVTRIAVAMAKELKTSFVELNISLDEVLAAGICHDVGKPFEYNPRNRGRWSESSPQTGFPAMRHTTYGVYIALTTGLPENIAHVVASHSAEGDLIERSTVAAIVHYADEVYWSALRKGGIVS